MGKHRLMYSIATLKNGCTVLYNIFHPAKNNHQRDHTLKTNYKVESEKVTMRKSNEL